MIAVKTHIHKFDINIKQFAYFVEDIIPLKLDIDKKRHQVT